MEIMYAILGFLSWRPFTGYDLKKMMSASTAFYWSGNNNQIYTTLVQMHRNGLVTLDVQHQEHLPSRKVYQLTDEGRSELNKWIRTSPAPPLFKKTFLVQLAWASRLDKSELDSLLEKYEYEVNMHLLMLNEKRRRGEELNPARTATERYIWEMVSENFLRSYAAELAWVRELREGIAQQ
ncbi:MAG: PadR family transcriptional regulator [Dehalococcoidales bacterium]|nr:PadR family transcriptional regulator [Dehalococcoidales bacterium]